MRPKSLLPTVLLSLIVPAGLLLAQSQARIPIGPQQPQLRGAPANTPKSPPEDLYFYSGEDGHTQVPLAVDTTQISVRFQAGVDAASARALLQSVAGVDAFAAASLTLTERNSVWAPLNANLTADAVRTLAAVLESDPNVIYAQPVYKHADEHFGGTDRAIAMFNADLDQSAIEALIESVGASVVKWMDYGRAEKACVFALPKGADGNAVAASNRLVEQYDKDVLWSNPDFVLERKLYYTPNDTLYPNQWHLNSTGQLGAKVDADINAPEAWNISLGSSTVIIAVIDEGMDLAHEDLTYVTGWNAIANNNNPAASGSENHATSVAGVAAAKGSNGIGVSGSCPNCKVMPIRLIVSGMTTADEAESFNYAWQNGAYIINNSWGPVGSVATLPSSTKTAIDAATTSGRGGKGCVVLFAAGNDGTNGDSNGYAAYSRVISVAASTDQDLQAYYSNYGNTIDVCAPSNGGNTTGITTTDRTGSVGYSSTNYTNNFGGTSSATPLTSGVCGLILTVNNNLTYDQVRTTLTSTATKIDQAGGGWSGGFSQKYGYGKVNAYAALVSAQGGGGGGGGTNATFNATNVPLSIPDNNTTGVTSTMNVATTGTLNSVSCSVNITHTYIGDLAVTLIHPDGTQAILHNHTGGSADNIVATYTVSNMNGKALNGAWKLKVVDNAAADVGTINSWSITVNYTPGGGGGGGTSTTYNFSSTNVPLSIPDNNTTGITSTLAAASTTGTITAVTVTMNITHTYKGDLVVTLIHPDNTQVILHNRTGGSTDNIITTFPTLTAPYQSLSTLNGKAANGTWKLKVQDLAAVDVGTLNSWSIGVTTLTP